MLPSQRIHRPTLAILALLPAIANGQGLIIIEPPPPTRQVLPLELRSHQVNVEIRDQVATTRVDQVFYNPGSAVLEGTFLFPLPKGAHLDRFAMDINGNQTEAELLDADKARAIYEQIVRQTRDPALLEYCEQGLLRARIFPIEPHADKHVTVEYTELLRKDSGLVSYTYPSTNRSATGRPPESAFAESVRVDLETTSPLANVYSPSHDVEVKRKGENQAVIGFESDQLGNRDFQLYFSSEPRHDQVALSVLTYRDAQPNPTGDSCDTDGYFIFLASPELLASDRKPLPKDIVFALDTSGSMAGDKLEQAKHALRFCLANLNDDDRFEIVRFSTDVEPLFGALNQADKQHLDQARNFIERLKPIGGTAIHDALNQCLATAGTPNDDRPRFVVFLTDGRPTIGQTADNPILETVKQSAEQTRVFCFGIGTDINTKLLDKITQATRATSEYVLPDEDLELKVSRFYTKISHPVLANPTFILRGDVRLKKMYPIDLPDLFCGDQLVILGRYAGSGKVKLVLEGSAGPEKSAFTTEAHFAAVAAEHGFIARIWAMRRVGFLLDEIRLRGENDELKAEVVQLARTYGIVTPYTAYLIVEDEDRRVVPLQRQSLSSLNANEPVRGDAELLYRGMEADESGAGAVAGAKANLAMKEARTAAAPGQAGLAIDRAAPTSSRHARSRQQLNEQMQQSRFINGRAFIQNGNQWTDTLVQQYADARVVQIAFNSDAYFQLMRDHPETAPWLSVGRNLQLVVGKTIYQIVDPTP